MRGDAEYDAWSQAIGDRVEHQDDCHLVNGGCSAPFSTRIVYCPVGQQLADAENAAHQAWSDGRRPKAAAS